MVTPLRFIFGFLLFLILVMAVGLGGQGDLRLEIILIAGVILWFLSFLLAEWLWFQPWQRARQIDRRMIDLYRRELIFAQLESRQALRQLSEDNRLKDDFLANMSHELRTPMNGIIGLSDLLKDEPLTKEQSRTVQTIHRSAKGLLEILNDILDLSKIRSDNLDFETVPFDLTRIVQDVVELLQPISDEKGIDIYSEIGGEVANFYMGDPVRVRQVLTNVVSNAVKFTEEGAVEITVSCSGFRGRNNIEFEIRDSGIGIASDKAENIFEKFQQADSATTRKYGGSGLGLTIVKALTDLMGGTVSFESKVGQGTTFRFTLPLLPASDQQVELLFEGSQPSELSADHDFQSFYALIVDDHPVNIMFTEKLLKKMGFGKITAVETGKEAVDIVFHQKPDVTLMDCQMPDIDGFEATRQIRERERQITDMAEDKVGHRSLIIAMTAHAMAKDRERCLAAGMDDYISKPVDIEKMRMILRRWLIEG